MKKNNILVKDVVSSSQKSVEKDYWLNKLSGNIDKVIFPYDNNHQVREIELATSRFDLSDDVSQKILKISNGSLYKMHVLLFTAGVILLSRYSNNNDTIMGIPILKQKDGVKFINSVLALRNRLNYAMTCKELLFLVNDTIIEAYDHQNFSIQRILYNLNMTSNSDFPLFDVALLLENIHKREYLNNTPINIIFSFSLVNDLLYCDLEYNSYRYHKDTIARIIRHYKEIITQIVSNPDIKIADIKLLNNNEEKQILADFNNFPIPIPGEVTIKDLFEKQVKLNGEANAVAFEEETITYAKLNEKANQLARILIKKGVKVNSTVGIIVERSIDMIVGILAIIKAGAVYLPMDWEYPPQRNQYLLKDSDTRFVLTHSYLSDSLQAELSYLNSVNTILIDDNSVFKEDSTNVTTVNKVEDLAYIIYTSGTTGNPKGVMINHSNVINLVYGLERKIYSHYDKNLRISMLSPYVFDASVKQIFAALLLGHCLYIVPKEKRISGSDILAFYNEYKIDISDGTPAHLQLMIENAADGAKNIPVKHFLIGGEALPHKQIERFFDCFPGNNITITNVYGPTECCVDASSFDITKENINSFIETPIGYPMPNCKIYILDEKLRVQPIGVKGEMYIGGQGVGRGYLKRNELTREKFISNPFCPGQLMYKTGDIAYWLPDGTIIFSGRADFQIKIRGFRVELGELESEIINYQGISEAIVVVNKDRKNDAFLCAYFVANQPINIADLRTFLSQKIPEYLLPTYFTQLETMPLNNNAKIDRKNLPIPEFKLERKYQAPSNAIEEKLVDIWAEILDLDKAIISTDINFFEIGGHSLKLTLLNDKIIKEFTIQSSMAELFNAKSIKNQADYIARALKENFLIKDDHLVLLRKGNTQDNNIFLIHGVGGGVEAFVDFANNLSPIFNCWGLKTDKMIGNSPVNLTMEDLGKKYITSIKKVQPDGPYTLAGWSLGGIIVFEIARQLEELNETVDFLGLIDPIPPKIELWQEIYKAKNVASFTCETELDVIKDWFSDESVIKKMSQIDDLSKFWLNFIEYCDQNVINIEILKEKIAEPVDKDNPTFKQMDIRALLALFNTRRTFRRTYGNYNPMGKVQTAIHYFGATLSDGEHYKEELAKYSHEPLRYYTLKGDHFSIFKHPEVLEFAQLFNDLLAMHSLDNVLVS